ncbi:MAG: hypothetical protein ACE5F1_01175 [Planctomycetota bacterium]
MKASLAMLVSLGFSLCLGEALSAQCQSQCTGQEKANPAVAGSKAKLPAAPTTKLAQKIANLTPEQRKIAGEAFRSLTSSCPLGRRTPQTIFALQSLYSEASSSLAKIASAKKIDPAFKADLDRQVSVISKLARINGATISVLEQLAGKSECCAGCAATAKTDGACEGPGDGQGECAAKAESEEAKPRCNISFANSLVSDWAKGMKEFSAMTEESKAELRSSFKVLGDLGLEIPQFISNGLRKQSRLLREAVGAMACPESGILARNAEILAQCETTRTSLSGASARLAAASKLLMAVPFVTKQAASSADCSGTCPSEGASPAGETCGECSEAKPATKQGGCPSKVKTVKN